MDDGWGLVLNIENVDEASHGVNFGNFSFVNFANLKGYYLGFFFFPFLVFSSLLFVPFFFRW